MRLTAEHVARVYRAIPEEPFPEGLARSTESDHEATIERLLAANPGAGEIWFFAYGSLIWKPACAFVEVRTGLLRGWHRAFCLGWNKRFRGNDEHPGLMLALDRGGACNGVLYRLPTDAIEANLKKLFEREMGSKPSAFPPRWVNVVSGKRVIRALTFCIDRKSGRYVSGLSDDEIADVLAHAVGSRGSMAEYLFATVSHLERMGVHDSHLWTLQELVAERIEQAYGAERVEAVEAAGRSEAAAGE
jgi:cation transport protein ChaC